MHDVFVNMPIGRPTGLLGERGTVSPAGYLTLAAADDNLGHFLPCKYFETFPAEVGELPAGPCGTAVTDPL